MKPIKFDKLLPILHQESSPNFDILKTILPVKEFLDNTVEKFSSGHPIIMEQLIGLGLMKPGNPIIYAPQMNVMVKIGSENTTIVNMSDIGNVKTIEIDDHSEYSHTEQTDNSIRIYQEFSAMLQECFNHYEGNVPPNNLSQEYLLKGR